MLLRYLEKLLHGWANSEAYLEPSSETSRMELFMKIINN